MILGRRFFVARSKERMDGVGAQIQGTCPLAANDEPRHQENLARAPAPGRWIQAPWKRNEAPSWHWVSPPPYKGW